MFRFWDGSSWSEQTTSDPSSPAPGAPVPPPAPAAPAAPTMVSPSAYPQQPADPYQQQYAAQPGQYAGGGYGAQGYPGAPGGSGGGSGNKVLLIALAVLLIAGLAVGGFFGVRALTDDDGDDSASDDISQSEETDDETDDAESPTDETEDPTASPPTPTDSPTDTGPTGYECTGGHPGGGQASGDGSISGGDLTLPPVSRYSNLEPQITTTFAFADGVAGVGRSIEEQWISLYAVGGLPKSSGYFDLEASVDQVITCMTDSPNFYRNFTGREDLEREAIQVDGHDAYAVTSEIRVDDPEITVDGDYSKVIVVDTGDDEKFGLYVAVVPIGHQKLIDQLEAATEQLQVDG